MAVKKPKIEMWAIERLIPYDKNAKIHTQGQVESLAEVIKTQGWDVPIVVDRDGSIIKGHGRRLAAIHMGLKEVPVICRTDLTPAQVRAARLSDNRVALTDFDTELVKEELTALSQGGFEMGSLGFDAKELEMLVSDLDVVDASVFDTPEPAANDSESSEAANDDGKPSDPPAAPTVDMHKLLGFKTIPSAYERTMAKFQSYAESMTDKRGSDAFGAFCEQLVAEIEARS